MKLLGNRVLVKRVPKPEASGFAEVKAVDDFVGSGVIVMRGDEVDSVRDDRDLEIGTTIVFAKFSPDTRTIEHEGEEMKSVLVSDIIATL